MTIGSGYFLRVLVPPPPWKNGQIENEFFPLKNFSQVIVIHPTINSFFLSQKEINHEQIELKTLRMMKKTIKHN